MILSAEVGVDCVKIPYHTVYYIHMYYTSVISISISSSISIGRLASPLRRLIGCGAYCLLLTLLLQL